MLLRSSSNRKRPAWPVPSEKMTTFLPIAKSSYDNPPLSILGGMVWKLILIFLFGARTDVAKVPRPIFATAGFIFICADNFSGVVFLLFFRKERIRKGSCHLRNCPA